MRKEPNMLGAQQESGIHSLHFSKEVEIAAPPAVVFESILEELGPSGASPEGVMPMKIEPWPGGRWYRDLGDGAGHLWGHVQVIKPPLLLEITGPLFMSYAAASHVQYRLTPGDDGRTTLALTHRAIGQIPREHREGVAEGWGDAMRRIRENAEQRAREST